MNRLNAVYTQIPNFLTALNLLSGCVGIVMVFEDKGIYATYMIWLAALFDFFDGLVARLLKAYSKIGLQFDSLADVISFGLLPSCIMYGILEDQLSPATSGWAYLAFLVAVFSALRLAKFNIDTRQSDTFYGIPTPANALLYSALPLIIAGNGNFTYFEMFQFPIFLVLFIIITSWLLVSEIRMLNLKFKSLHWFPNRFRFIFMILALVLIFFLNVNAIPLIFAIYILLSLLSNRYLYN